MRQGEQKVEIAYSSLPFEFKALVDCRLRLDHHKRQMYLFK
jgi:hypothetical protein